MGVRQEEEEPAQGRGLQVTGMLQQPCTLLPCCVVPCPCKRDYIANAHSLMSGYHAGAGSSWCRIWSSQRPATGSS